MDKLKRSDQRESYCSASIAQPAEQPAFTRTVGGSNPSGSIDGCNALLALYQLWRRDRKAYEEQTQWGRCPVRWLN